jgi:hypothetical protein
MKTPRLAAYLGRHVEHVLGASPFSEWERPVGIIDEDGDRVDYEVVGRGVELVCSVDRTLLTIFIHREAEGLFELPFRSSRARVSKLLGRASRTGTGAHVEGLRPTGAWVRFDRAAFSLHIQFALDRDEIEMVTLMHSTAVPDSDGVVPSKPLVRRRPIKVAKRRRKV